MQEKMMCNVSNIFLSSRESEASREISNIS